MNDPRRRSPLDHRQSLGEAKGLVQLFERAFLGKWILRVDGLEAKNAGLELPIANQVLDTGNQQILWLGPDEWMFIAPAGPQSKRRLKSLERLDGIHHQISDVSDYYTIIRVAGNKSAELLMKVSNLDLHPRGFGAGDVAGSVFGKANAWLTRGEDQNVVTFDLIIRWSMADYLWCLLAQAGREFGLPAQTPRGQEKGLRYKNK